MKQMALAKHLAPPPPPSSEDDEWYTKKKYIKLARLTFGEPIALDPASCAAANAVVGAQRHYTAEDDGLAQSWQAPTIWLNPPYSHPLIENFVDKLLDALHHSDFEQALLLTNNKTETAWWHKAAQASTSVLLFRSRVFFWRPGQEGETSPRNGQSLFYFGHRDSAFRHYFGTSGIIYP